MFTSAALHEILSQIAQETPTSGRVECVLPRYENAGHGINFENANYIGNFIVWPNGMCDWEVFSVATNQQKTVGHSAVESIEDLREKAKTILASYALVK